MEKVLNRIQIRTMVKQKIISGRWESKTSPLHICICGKCFDNLEDWVLHKKDTKSWKKYHERVNVYGVFRVMKRRKLT